MVFTVFSKAQPSKVWYSLRFWNLSQVKVKVFLCSRRLSRAKNSMHYAFEGSAEQSMLLIMLSKLPQVHDADEPRAGVQLTCQTSSGSSCLEPNIDRERIRGMRVSKVGFLDFSIFSFQSKLLAQPDIYIYIYMCVYIHIHIRLVNSCNTFLGIRSNMMGFWICMCWSSLAGSFGKLFLRRNSTKQTNDPTFCDLQCVSLFEFRCASM